jgi:hypothetical protein
MQTGSHERNFRDSRGLLTGSSELYAPKGHEPIVGRGEALGVAATAILFGVVFSYPIVVHLGELRLHADWDAFWDRRWIPYITVTAFHRLPLWDPWRCGGMPMLGEVQSSIISPFFLLDFIVGFARGVHLEILLHLAIAWAGGYLLGRVLSVRAESPRQREDRSFRPARGSRCISPRATSGF